MSRPDIVLIDYDQAENLDPVVRVLSLAPHARIVLWMHRPSVEMAYQAMNLGVRGILRKTLSTELTVKCLQKVAAGEPWFEKEFTSGFAEGRAVTLTPRESELVMLLSQGLRNKEIASALSITDATVRVYLSALFRKVGVKDRYELALYGLRNMATSLPGEPGESRVRLLVVKKAAAGVRTAAG